MSRTCTAGVVCRGAAPQSGGPVRGVETVSAIQASSHAVAKQAAEFLRRRGLRVQSLPAGESLCRLVRRLKPALVLLEAQARPESGFLLCAKLRREHPQLRVVLTGDRRHRGDARFATFAGAAAYLTNEDAPEQVERLLAELARQAA